VIGTSAVGLAAAFGVLSLGGYVATTSPSTTTAADAPTVGTESNLPAPETTGPGRASSGAMADQGLTTFTATGYAYASLASCNTVVSASTSGEATGSSAHLYSFDRLHLDASVDLQGNIEGQLTADDFLLTAGDGFRYLSAHADSDDSSVIVRVYDEGDLVGWSTTDTVFMPQSTAVTLPLNATLETCGAEGTRALADSVALDAQAYVLHELPDGRVWVTTSQEAPLRRR
jgi:hypothetical protein